MDTTYGLGYGESHGYFFQSLDGRLQHRFRQLVSEHTHAVNAAVNGLSALPGTATAFAATRAMSRFLNNTDIPFHALLEPAQDAVRHDLHARQCPVALVIHDWSMLAYNHHDGKKDRLQRSHDTDLGYELGSALVVDANDGLPLGPVELRLRTADGLISTRPGELDTPAGHADEVIDVMDAVRRGEYAPTLVHVIDREADSVAHSRVWHARGHRFVVRADSDRFVQWNGQECQLKDVVARLEGTFRDAPDTPVQPTVVTIQAGTGRVRVAETEVVLHRPARRNTGETTAGGYKRKTNVPGPPIRLRLVVTRVVSESGEVLAEWYLLTNVPADLADTATIGRWYAWRWRTETFYKLLKTAGMNVEEWQQESGPAVLRRLCVACLACLTVWHLRRDASPEAARLRVVLVRLSGRQMKHGAESTPPSLLAGLEKLLALDDLLRHEDLDEILALARTLLPQLFDRRRDPPVEKL